MLSFQIRLPEEFPRLRALKEWLDSVSSIDPEAFEGWLLTSAVVCNRCLCCCPGNMLPPLHFVLQVLWYLFSEILLGSTAFCVVSSVYFPVALAVNWVLGDPKALPKVLPNWNSSSLGNYGNFNEKDGISSKSDGLLSFDCKLCALWCRLLAEINLEFNLNIIWVYLCYIECFCARCSIYFLYLCWSDLVIYSLYAH